MNPFYPLLLCILLNISLSLSKSEASENECDARPKALVVSKGKEMLVEGPSSPFERRFGAEMVTKSTTNLIKSKGSTMYQTFSMLLHPTT
jgi:hypothetical protein